MSPPKAKAPVREFRLAEWPEAERAAWERARTPVRSPFRKEGGGRVFSPVTMVTRQRSYGNWLAYLRDAGQLDIAVSPSSRVTPERLDLSIQTQHARGNRPNTIVNRISDLKAVLDVLEPGTNHRWVIRPRGIPIQRYFDLEPLVKKVHHSAELILWAEKLFAAGLVHRNPRARRAMVRDAVMIGILVMPAPRVGALVQFKIGQNLQRHADGWCIDQHAGITKMGRDEWSPLLSCVEPMLERYLSVERGELLDGGMNDRLWIAQDGKPLTLWAISSFLTKRSLRHFGQSFRGHAFRRSLATTLAVEGHDSLGDASLLLGHTNPNTTGRHYNKANSFAASARHAERLLRMQRQAEIAYRLGIDE